jgi:hypothetical protein
MRTSTYLFKSNYIYNIMLLVRVLYIQSIFLLQYEYSSVASTVMDDEDRNTNTSRLVVVVLQSQAQTLDSSDQIASNTRSAHDSTMEKTTTERTATPGVTTTSTSSSTTEQPVMATEPARATATTNDNESHHDK